MKKLTSIFLVLAMLLTLAPMNVFGANTVNISSEQIENMTQEEYAQWKQNLVSQNRVRMMSIDSSSEEVEGDYSANIEGYIRNEFIEAYINSDGHYTMGTTGGNPDSASDNNKLLLFGHPGSSTTETLIKIDNEETYFYSNNTIFNSERTQATTTATIDDVEVKQIITLETNTYTGNADVASIKYIMTNNSSQAKQIGGRIMLDTMLGNNDGAPFRIPGIGNVTSEIELSGNDIPEYWQAFDNLTTPNVISTGNFYRTAAEKPDKVQFAYWGDIRGSSWNYAVSNQSVTGDSAVASYYNPRTVLPGQSRTIVTYYGISDFSSSDVEDDITLRVSAPSFLGGNNEGYLNNPFVVTAYIGNYTSSTVNNITARISLPEELQIEGSDPTTKNVGSISSGTETFTKWTVRALPQETGKTITYNITINGEGIDEKTIPISLNLYTTNDLYRNISFNLNGGDGVAPETQRVLVGTKGTEPEKPTRTGYVFKGWYANPQCTGVSWFSFLNTGALLRTTENITLYAKWVDNQILQYGRDTFNFENTEGDFFGGWNQFWGNTNYKITGDYYDILLRNQNNRQSIINSMNSSWGGSCFGMACVLSLVKAGELDEVFFQDDALNLFDLEKPKDNKTVFNLVNYYMLMQFTNTTNRAVHPNSSEIANNRNLVNVMKNSAHPVVLCFYILRDSDNVSVGGHAVVAYDMQETDEWYNISIWDPNDQDNPITLQISKDFNQSEFLNTWYDNATYHSYTASALTVENSDNTYDYRNIQNELIALGRSNGAEGIALMSLNNEETMEIVLNYNSFQIESSAGATAVITNGIKTDGDLDVVYSGTLNEFGKELKIKFSLPQIGENEYYIIKPAAEQRSIVTDEPLSEYITNIADNSYNGFYNKVVMSDNGEIKIYNDGSMTTTNETAVEQSILTSINNSNTSTLFELSGKDVEISQGEEEIQLSGTEMSNTTMTISDGYNTATVENIPTSTDSISVSQNNNDFIIKNASDMQLASTNLGYSVVFYTLGGTLIDAITNITSGSTIAKPEDPTREGFIFDGWYLSTAYNDNEKWDFDSDVVEDNVRLYAKWLADENYMHSVTFKSDGNDDIVIIVKHGDELTEIPNVPAKLGYVGQWDVTDFSSITSNIIVNALYSPTTGKAVKPVASPAGGNYSSAQTITLSTTTEGAEIYYTLNGSAPSSNSQKYSQPITISSTTTLKAVAVKGGMLDSDVMTETYNISNGGSTTGGGGGGGGTPSYKITVTQGENGTISPSSASVTKNGDKTFTIVANEGYEIEDVIVDGESVGAVTSYTFEKVTKAATITAKFKKIEESKVVWENPFKDVNKDDWFYEAVKFASEKGITSGISKNKFAPNDKVTRGQFITMLCRAYGIKEMTGDNFNDSGNTWYSGYLAAAKQLGISKGVGDNKFAPEKEITREEMVTLIYNYLKSIGEVDEEIQEATFADNDSISNWAKAGVAFASEKGYVNGKGNNLFDPNGDATRAELAQIFFNMLK